MKILKTNWINILGVGLTLFIYSLLNSIIGFDAAFSQALFGAFLLIGLYGLIFWVGFLIVLIVLDYLLIIPAKNNLKQRLLLEWLIIIIPFVYWAVIYERQRVLFIVAMAAFLITQLLREKLIIKARR